MNEQRTNYQEIGMLVGVIIGSAAGTVMVIITGQAFYFGLVGVGLALGAGMGAAYDGRRALDEDDAE